MSPNSIINIPSCKLPFSLYEDMLRGGCGHLLLTMLHNTAIEHRTFGAMCRT